MKKILICIDRDGTLIYDDKYYLGKSDDWKSKIEFLPTVIEGLRKLKTLANVRLYMITNQSGIAITDFSKLTLQRANEVCDDILQRLKKQKTSLTGYFVCPHVNYEYVKRKSELSFDKSLICDCDCLKPNLGMVFSALEKEGWNRESVDLYVIGDRLSDVQTGLNAGGKGIFVPFSNENEEVELVDKLCETNNKLYKAKNFMDSVNWIIDDLNNGE